MDKVAPDTRRRSDGKGLGQRDSCGRGAGGTLLTTGITSTGPTISAAFQLSENVIRPCLKSPLYTTLEAPARVKVFGAIGARVVATSVPQAHVYGQASRMPGVLQPMFTASAH